MENFKRLESGLKKQCCGMTRNYERVGDGSTNVKENKTKETKLRTMKENEN